MQYLSQILMFQDWLETNPSDASTISLWYAIMGVANKSGWQEWFSVPIQTLELKAGLSRSGVYRARNRLIQLGRIETKERKGQQCSLYKIIPFVSQYDTQSGTQCGTQSGTQCGTQRGTQRGTINKIRKDKKRIYSNAHARERETSFDLDEYDELTDVNPVTEVGT